MGQPRDDAHRAVCIQPPWYEGCEVSWHTDLVMTCLNAGEYSRHIKGTDTGRACMCPVESKASTTTLGQMFSFWIQKCQSGYEEWYVKWCIWRRNKKCSQRVSIFGWKNFFIFQKCPIYSPVLIGCSKGCPPDSKLRRSFQKGVPFSWSNFRRVFCSSS